MGVIGQKKQLPAHYFFDQSHTFNSAVIYVNTTQFGPVI